VVVGIDEESLRTFNVWPWPRYVHGEFLQYVGLTNPSVIAWDILFVEPAARPEDDAAFVEGLKRSRANVVFGAVQEEKEEDGVKPDSSAVKASSVEAIKQVEGDRSRLPTTPAMLLAVGQLSVVGKSGFVNTPPESDGVRRRVPLVVRVGDEVYPSLSLQALMQYWSLSPSEVKVKLGDAITFTAPHVTRRIPIDDTGAFLVNFRYGKDEFHTIGYSYFVGQLKKLFLDKKDKSEIGVLPTEGAIVLVGETADALSDMGPTPFSPLTPLVLVHANVIDNVLREDYASRAPWWPVWLGTFVTGVAGLALFSKRKLVSQAAFALGVPVGYVLIATIAWVKWSLWLPVIWPLAGFLALQVFMIVRRMIAEQRAKEQIKGMFGTYISPELVKQMVASGVQPQLGGHDEEITAYFSDIQSFSTFSEKLGSGPLVELMNEYLTACTDIVQDQGGTLDKYIGDAVVAMFGAPIPLSDHAYRACVATQLVHQRLAELRAKWQSEGSKWPEIVWKMQSRIGLNTGVCMIGNMGSRTRFNYTMMGDNVNLAARMESGSKAWGAYTMCAEATKLACEKHGGDRVVFRPLGRIVVKGRTQAVPIFEIVGLKEHVTPKTSECVGIFAQGLEKYYARDWDGALNLFSKSRDLEFNIPGRTPGVVSNPSLVYLDITAHYRDEPPPENWDGVYVMKEK
jgi:adenylate cyclase